MNYTVPGITPSQFAIKGLNQQIGKSIAAGIDVAAQQIILGPAHFLGNTGALIRGAHIGHKIGESVVGFFNRARATVTCNPTSGTCVVAVSQ